MKCWRMGDGRVDLASVDLIIGSYIYKEEVKGHEEETKEKSTQEIYEERLANSPRLPEGAGNTSDF